MEYREVTGTDVYDTQQKMVIVIAALVPSLMMGIYIFGSEALILTLVCVAAAVAADWLAGKAIGTVGDGSGGNRNATPGDRDEGTASGERGGAMQSRPSGNVITGPLDGLYHGAYSGDIRDLTAVVTGMILAFSLPARLPLWMAAAGSVIAIVVFKYLLGGLMDRIACPALAARIVMLRLFRGPMTEWPLNDFVKTSYDEPGAVNGSTPLTMLAEGKEIPGLLRMFIGFVSGPCGAASVAAILIGGLYLIWKKIISPKIPVAIIAVVFISALIYYVAAGDSDEVMNGMGRSALYMAVFHLFTGGVLFTAFFCAPLCEEALESSRKLAVYAAGIGLITMAVRFWGTFEDGAALALVVMNILMCVWALAAGKNHMARPDDGNAYKEA